MSWTDEFRHELALAHRARGEGNEGRARVCARRAAGISAREYLRLRGEPVPAASAYDLLQRLASLADTPQGVRQSALFLTMRVDEEFKLPEAVDLIAEATALCRALHPDLDI